MRRALIWIFATLEAFSLSSASQATELGIHVMLSGQVAPGIYGQVQIGPQEPPPPLVYARPLVIEPRAVLSQPVYLHVPPGHARNWRKHCHAYNACNRPVYFVRSEEYSSDSGEAREHGHSYRDHDSEREHGERGHKHEERGEHHGEQ